MIPNYVAVLGSFDTWTYMDYVAQLVAQNKFVVLTSRYEYSWDHSRNQVTRKPTNPGKGVPMMDVLKNDIIRTSDLAIIIYSVPAAHYNEAHWCYEMQKTTLGIAFVRDVEERGPSPTVGTPGKNCSQLIADTRSPPRYSACGARVKQSVQAQWTGWDCKVSEPCPFKKQGIALNQVEYFQINNSYMRLFAVENLEHVEPIVSDFLAGNFSLP